MNIETVLSRHPGTRAEDWRQVGGGWARVTAHIGNGARIGEWARVRAKAHFETSPLYIIGSQHRVYEYVDGTLCVGCEEHTIEEWLANYEQIGRANGYNAEQILEYKDYFALYAKQCGRRAARRAEAAVPV